MVLYQQKVTVELNQRHLIVRVSTLKFPLSFKYTTFLSDRRQFGVPVVYLFLTFLFFLDISTLLPVFRFFLFVCLFVCFFLFFLYISQYLIKFVFFWFLAQVVVLLCTVKNYKMFEYFLLKYTRNSFPIGYFENIPWYAINVYHENSL